VALGGPESASRGEILLARGARRGSRHGSPRNGVGQPHPIRTTRSWELSHPPSGARPELLSSSEREEIRRLRKENYELRRANEILKSASVFFAKELDPDRPK
jgi:transposase